MSTPTSEGIFFENETNIVLSRFNGTLLREKEIKQKFGKECSGIDFYLLIDNKNIFCQCKWENSTPSINDINHFLQSCKNTNVNNNVRKLFISKLKPTEAGITSLGKENGISINDNISMFKCLEKLENYVKNIINKETTNVVAINTIQTINIESEIQKIINNNKSQIQGQLVNLNIYENDIKYNFENSIYNFNYKEIVKQIKIVHKFLLDRQKRLDPINTFCLGIMHLNNLINTINFIIEQVNDINKKIPKAKLLNKIGQFETTVKIDSKIKKINKVI